MNENIWSLEQEPHFRLKCCGDIKVQMIIEREAAGNETIQGYPFGQAGIAVQCHNHR